MSSFSLNTGDSAFNTRQKQVFDQLCVLEPSRNVDTPKEPEETEPRHSNRSGSKRAHRSDTKSFRGKESIFKKPQNPIPRNYLRRVPDFKKNPHKWTKYSLEDVQEMTDESNTKSAMDFLKELEQRRHGMIIEEKLEELPSKIVFNKHVKIVSTRTKTDTSETDYNPKTIEEEKPSFNHSKRVMPEYVIGQKPNKKDSSSKKSKPEKGKELKLDHLTFEDD